MPPLRAAARAGGSSRDAMIDDHCKAEAEAEAEELAATRARFRWRSCRARVVNVNAIFCGCKCAHSEVVGGNCSQSDQTGKYSSYHKRK